MRTLAALLLLAVPAVAAPVMDTVTLPGGTKVPRATRADHHAVILTPHFAVRYFRYEEIVANREDADKHAIGVAGALEQAWSAILTKQKFRLRADSWMQKNRINVVITDLEYLGVASTNRSRTKGKIRVDVYQDITDADLLKATCAHELFHLVQYEYQLGEDHWIYDATAVWMEDKAFPTRAAAKPTTYGARYYTSAWNRTWPFPLPWENRNHAYADAFFIQYLTEQRGDGLVRALWERMGAVAGDNTGAAFERVLGGRDRPWGPEFADCFLDFAVANLIRDRRLAPAKRYGFGTLTKPLPLVAGAYPVKARTFGDWSLAGLKGGAFKTLLRAVQPQGMKYDRLDLPAAMSPGPVDLAVLAKGSKDEEWGFAAVAAPKTGKWTVNRFTPAKGDEWLSRTIRVADPANDKLYVAFARPRRERADARFTAVLLSPPVVTRFEIVEPDPQGGARQPVWVLVRRPYDQFTGRAWRTGLTEDWGLTWRETQSRAGEAITIRVETNRPVVAPLTVRLAGSGRRLEVRLSVAGAKSRYEAEVPLTDLEPLCREADRLTVEIEARDALGRGLDGKPGTAPDLEPVEGEEPTLSWIDFWEGGPVAGAAIGGKDDLGGRPIAIRRENALPVELVDVRAEAGGRPVYDTREGIYRPAGAGKIDLTLTFRRAMDRARPADVRLGERAATGAWRGDRVWSGAVTPGPEAFPGRPVLAVAASAADGTPLDADADQPGAQPDTKHRLLLDPLPVHLASLEVAGGGTVFYSARWEGGADLEAEPNVGAKVLAGRRERKLVVRRTADLPSSGVATLVVSLGFSGRLPAPPDARLAGVRVGKLESKDGRFWIGEVSAAEIRSKQPTGSVAVRVEARAAAGRGLDADPRTVPAATDRESVWSGYESTVGGPDDGHGGPDEWHRIEAPPRMSYVMVLDASGSMRDQDRLVNAKQAIRALLDQLPEDVELGLVVFLNPDDIRSLGFTRDRERFFGWVEPVQPDGGTPLAGAIDRARVLLEDQSHPASRAWRYRIFSDGKETAGGNVVEAVTRMDAAIARHRGLAPRPTPPRVPPPKRPLPEPCPVEPASWQSFRVEVEEHEPFDWIFLVETTFTERELPDGRAEARLEERSFGIAYGAVTPPDGVARATWRVHSRPDEVRVDDAASDEGRAAVERVRRKARSVSEKGSSLAECNAKIEAIVRENVK